jgi:hypothetical protein
MVMFHVGCLSGFQILLPLAIVLELLVQYATLQITIDEEK